ncbi:THAP-type domain-containing protein [Trichonephila clavipes]|nr:THAP-type domain-containing protein [Trichonephila clavipes]
MNAEDLHSMTLEILSLMEKVGFSVACILSDNRVNINCFSKLCNGTIKSVIQNPANNAKKLHLIFDSVHLIKPIRNNWLNQKDADSSLMYPDPSEFSQIRKATFSSLFKIYNEEMNIVKLAPKLCLKALKPTNFEKQNVKLDLKIFEESNVTSLNILKDKLGYPEMFRDTAIFIKYILDFWQIMNIKNPTVKFARKFKILYRWRGHREERDLELNEDSKGKKRRGGSDQHGGAIGHGRMSGIVGDDLNKMMLT